MPNENNLFSDIPSLGDAEGLQNFMNAQAAPQPDSNLGIPAALQPVESAQVEQPAPAQEAQPQPQAQPQTYTSEDVQKIIQSVQAQRNAQMQPAPQMQPQPTAPAAQGYNPQELAFINQALAKGYSLAQIEATIKAKRQPTMDANAQRIADIEQYLQRQEYAQQEQAFVNKMNAFGEKFGLSENDLVTFGNFAMTKGINLVDVTDVETIFKALYPEQYAIRSQRMQNTSTSQIYGGTSVPEASRAAASKAEDAYVDAFLQRAMPNQYGMYKK